VLLRLVQQSEQPERVQVSVEEDTFAELHRRRLCG